MDPVSGRGELTFSALASSKPTKIHSVLLDDICNPPLETNYPTIKPPVSAVIIQEAEHVEYKGYHCEKQISTLFFLCRTFSYSKIEQPLDIMIPEAVQSHVCELTVCNSVLFNEINQQLLIQPRETVYYKYARVGDVTHSHDNVRSNGGHANGFDYGPVMEDVV